MVRSSCCGALSVILRVRILNLCIESLDKPDPLPYRNIIGLRIRKPTIID